MVQNKSGIKNSISEWEDILCEYYSFLEKSVNSNLNFTLLDL